LPQKSPTKPDAVESPHPSPQQLEHDIPSIHRLAGPSQLASVSASTSTEKHRPPPVNITDSPNLGSTAPSKPQRQESSENLNKGFKVTLEDPTWKVLPAALKKYRINNDNWQSYAMFICYGSPGENTRPSPNVVTQVEV
jgi:bZIP factor